MLHNRIVPPSRDISGYDVIEAAPMVLTEDDIVAHYRAGGTFHGGMGAPEYVRLATGQIIYLNVPLCEGCETTLDHGCCHHCQCIYVDPPVVTEVTRTSATGVVA